MAVATKARTENKRDLLHMEEESILRAIYGEEYSLRAGYGAAAVHAVAGTGMKLARVKTDHVFGRCRMMRRDGACRREYYDMRMGKHLISNAQLVLETWTISTPTRAGVMERVVCDAYLCVKGMIKSPFPLSPSR